MKVTGFKYSGPFAVLAIVGVITGGCGEQPSRPTGGSTPASQVSRADDDNAGESHDHGGWWCVEHGVPEEDCSLCSANAASKFKEKGDWCAEHNRAQSQCFLCDPSRAEKFAKLYEAKFGHKPPQPTE
jgi:hypothetical protein